MDIVLASVRAARGRVDLTSEPGKGTTVAMMFPLSTAVLDALVVRLDERRFLIPVDSVLESIKINPSNLSSVASGTSVLTLRGDPLEVISLRRLLAKSSVPPADETVGWGVVTQTSEGARQIFLVDQVESKKEVVIRTLGPLFQNIPGVSAAAVLAGGTPALVLDVDQLVLSLRSAS